MRIAITAILLSADGRLTVGGQSFVNCTLVSGAVCVVYSTLSELTSGVACPFEVRSKATLIAW